jgi:VWFA-related protein
MYWFSRLLSVELLSVALVAAQTTQSPQLQTRTPAAPGAEKQITITVQVTDKSGAPIRGLQQQDFTLLDDKQPLNITAFHAVDHSAPASSDSPVEIILVVDAVNAGFQAVTYERNELRKFLLQNDGKLAQPVSLVIFTDTDTKIQNGSSRDGNMLAALYDQYQTGLRVVNRSQGFYGATERFDLSLKLVHALAAHEAAAPGRKLMLWISPGWPLLSGPRVELTSKEEKQIFNSIVATSTELREANVTLYNIDPLGLADFGVRTSYYEEFLKGVPFAKRAVPGDLGLQVLAVQSGGHVLNTTNDLTKAIASCAADAEVYYIVSFQQPKPDHPDEYHSIDVKVDKPGAIARTRTGYYAQP